MSEQNPPAGEAAPTPTPAPRPGPVPSPAALARPRPRPAAAPVVAHAPTDSARFGRVAEDGTVFVSEGESERAVGSYPGASAEDALQYFARKYDELHASAALLLQRVTQTDVSAHDATESWPMRFPPVTSATLFEERPTTEHSISRPSLRTYPVPVIPKFFAGMGSSHEYGPSPTHVVAPRTTTISQVNFGPSRR